MNKNASYEDLELRVLSLERERDFFKLIANNSTDMISQHDADGVYIYASPYSRVLLGYDPEELIGRNAYDYFHPDDMDRLRANHQNVLSETQVFNVSYRIRRKDNTYLWVESSSQVIPSDDSGHQGTIISITRDISEQRQKKEALKSEKDRFQTVLDATPFPVAIVDPHDNKIHFWSRSAMLLFGHTAPTTSEWYEIAYPDPEYRQEVIERWKPILEIARKTRQTVNTGEYQIACKDGSYRICQLYAAFLDKYLVVTFNDVTDRKQIATQLQASEELLENIMVQSPFAMWISDSDGMIIKTNKSLQEKLNLSDAEIVGNYNVLEDKNIRDQGKLPLVKSVFEEYQPNRFELNWKAAEAEFEHSRDLMIDVSMFPVLDDRGELTNVVCQWMDITEHHQSELARQDSEERFRQIFENIESGIAIYKAVNEGNDFVFQDINPSGARSGQISRQDHIGKSVQEIYPGVNEIGLLDVFRNVWTTGKPQRHPIAQYNDSRITLWVDNYVSKLPSGEVMAVYEDLTSKMKAQEALRESEDRYRSVYKTAPLAFVVWNTDCQITEWNDQATQIFGWERDEVINQNFFDLIIPETDRQFVKQVVDRLLAGDIEKNVVNQNLTKSGETIWCEWNSAVLHDAQGNVTSAISLGLDITDRVAVENELRDYRDHLEELVKQRTQELDAKNYELETFTYSVSHDLKAPLRGIDGYSRLLQEEYEDKLDEDGSIFLNNIRNATDQMNQLIEDLLAYSRMERKELSLVQTELASMISNLIQDCSHEITTRSVNVVNRIPFDTIICDRDCIRQVLSNLLDNALKFSRNALEPVIEFNGEETETHWQIWVKDNGIGIDKKYQERIFGIFQRLHRTEDYPGTGVGLALVKKSIQRMGGRIWLTSETGQGSVFYIEIPKPGF